MDLDEVLRALAHPERRQFLQACLERQCSAGELSELSSLSLASVSEHLKVLRKSGLLTLDKQGRYWLYRADRRVLRAALAQLSKIAEVGDGA